MRLQKFLSKIGFCSRSDAERLIAAGRVAVDGRRAIVGDRVSPGETVLVDGRPVLEHRAVAAKVIAFNKPQGVASTLSARPGAETLNDFDFGPGRVFPVGGLDAEASGLLLLTNDGELGHRLARPGARHADEYELTLTEHPAAEALERFKRELGSEKRGVVARTIRLEGDRMFCVLQEGRSKLLRRLCAMSGLEIGQVRRIRIGPVRLDHLAPGQWRLLSEDAVRELRRAAQGESVRRRTVGRRDG